MYVNLNNYINKKHIIKDIESKVDSLENIEKYLMEYNQVNGILDEEYVRKKKIAIIDCDGIISDGKSYYSEEGKALKRYGAYDKEMIKFLLKYNWDFYFVTDDSSGFSITERRFNDFLGRSEHTFFKRLSPIERYKLVNLSKKEYNLVLFIGDSLSDIPSLLSADIGASVMNAPSIVKNYSDISSDNIGSEGALADILYFIHINNGKIR